MAEKNEEVRARASVRSRSKKKGRPGGWSARYLQPNLCGVKPACKHNAYTTLYSLKRTPGAAPRARGSMVTLERRESGSRESWAAKRLRARLDHEPIAHCTGKARACGRSRFAPAAMALAGSYDPPPDESSSPRRQS